MKYVCLACGEVFDEDDIQYWDETHGLDNGPYEHWDGSPCCHAAYAEAHTCDCCGEYIIDDYIKVGDERFCNECFVHYNLGDED